MASAPDRRPSRATSSSPCRWLLFLVLNIGAILYAVYISVWKWNIRLGTGQLHRAPELPGRADNPTFQIAIKNTIYYTVLWVPLTMAVGLFLAVIVNQKIRGQTFFRAAFYFPAIASSAAITVLWIFLVAPERLLQRGPRRARPQPALPALRLRTEPELDRRPGHRDAVGHHPQRLDDLRHVHAVLPGVAPVDQPRGLRGGGDRRRQRLADVLAGHLPAAEAGPLLRGDGRGHRRRSSSSTRPSSAAARTATRTTR